MEKKRSVEEVSASVERAELPSDSVESRFSDEKRPHGDALREYFDIKKLKISLEEEEWAALSKLIEREREVFQLKEDLEKRIPAFEDGLKDAKAKLEHVSEVETLTKDLQSVLFNILGQLDPEAIQAAIEELRKRLAAVEAAPGGVSPELQTLSATVEGRMRELVSILATIHEHDTVLRELRELRLGEVLPRIEAKLIEQDVAFQRVRMLHDMADSLSRLEQRLMKVEASSSMFKELNKEVSTGGEMIKKLRLDVEMIRGEELEKLERDFDEKLSFVPVRLDEFRKGFKEDELKAMTASFDGRVKTLERELRALKAARRKGGPFAFLKKFGGKEKEKTGYVEDDGKLVFEGK